MSTTITALGHAAFLITSAAGDRLLIDPHAPGCLGGAMTYPALPEALAPGAVVCSHDHADHAALDAVPGAFALLDGAHTTWRGFCIWRHAVAHDEADGRRRGGMVDMLEIEVDGWRLLHGADVGQSPTPARIAALLARGDYHAALLPVGGFYTVGAAQAWEWWRRLGARHLIPAHHKTPWCHLPIRGVDETLACEDPSLYILWPVATFKIEDAPEHPIIVLPPLAAQDARSDAQERA